jgi:hypothetical protein
MTGATRSRASRRFDVAHGRGCMYDVASGIQRPWSVCVVHDISTCTLFPMPPAQVLMLILKTFNIRVIAICVVFLFVRRF